MARKALSPARLAVVQAVEGQREHLTGPVRIGLSGGADSLALVAAAAHCRLDAEAVVIDHQLQDGSGAIAEHAAATARALGLLARVQRVHVEIDGQGLESAARTARLDALADGATVLLGHTLDDQAETVLLGLGRGSGARSMQGMPSIQPWATGALARPLLGLRRTTTRQACRDQGLEVWDDPMNDDPRFRRVRVRHDLVPLMDDVLGGGVVEALGRTASLLREDGALLDELAAAAEAGCRAGDGLRVDALVAQPMALRSRVVRSWLVGRGVVEPSQGHVLAVLELVGRWHGQRGVDLPGGIRVRRDNGILLASPRPLASPNG